MGPLQGIKVLEFEAIGPAPFAGMLLADMGADVMRVDRAERPPISASKRERWFDVMMRGRRSVALDLKSEAASQRRSSSSRKADALIEGFRPGVMERLGLGPDVLLARNPAARLRPHDRLGPGRPAGARAPATTSTTSRSPACCTPSAARARRRCRRSTSSATSAAAACCWPSAWLRAARGAALRQGPGGRRRDGRRRRRCWRRCSRLVAAAAGASERGANMLDSGAPWYDVYETKDGKYVVDRLDRAALLRRAAASGSGSPARTSGAARPRALAGRCTSCSPTSFKAKTRAEWCEGVRGHRRLLRAGADMVARRGAHPHNVAPRQLRRARRRAATGAGAALLAHAGRDARARRPSAARAGGRRCSTGASTITPSRSWARSGSARRSRPCSDACCPARASSSSCSTSTPSASSREPRARRDDRQLQRARGARAAIDDAERAADKMTHEVNRAAAQDLHHADRPRADPQADQRDGRHRRPDPGRRPRRWRSTTCAR